MVAAPSYVKRAVFFQIKNNDEIEL